MIRPEDLNLIYSFSEPSMSNDSRKVVFSLRKPNIKDDTYDTNIWLMKESKELMQLTYSNRDYNPIFSEDGKRILFLSRRGFQKEEKGSSIYVISLDGGEAIEIVRRKEPIEKAAWSKDGKKIFFISNVRKTEKDDVILIDKPYFWFNGEGFTYNRRKHLFAADVKTKEVEQLTGGNSNLKDFAVSPDGEKIAYISSQLDLKPYITDIFVVFPNRKIVKLTKSNMEFATVCWFNNENLIALGRDFSHGFSSHMVLWKINLSGELEKIDRVEKNKANTLNSDVRSSAHGSHKVVCDSGYIYYLQANGGSVNLYRFKSSPEEIITGERSIEEYDVKNGVICFVSMNSYEPEELYLFDGSKETKITSFNDEACKKLKFIKPEYFGFNASDKVKIDCWLLAEQKNRKIPCILYIHGGPKTAFGNSFMFELQFFAKNGYAVLYTNPRGSDGYDENFADIRGGYGKRDFLDLMEAVENALSKFNFIDSSKLGVAGGSYGGFMTNWIIGHTNRFKAAVTDRSISNWISMWGTSDIGPYFTEDQIGADPWENWAKLYQDSPLAYVKNVETPLLIIHSLEDYRCWQVEAFQFFTALKMHKKEAKLALFPSENHDLSRAGKPKHRTIRLKLYLDWFNKYLKH